jgi:hypothetical protein
VNLSETVKFKTKEQKPQDIFNGEWVGNLKAKGSEVCKGWTDEGIAESVAAGKPY